MDIRESLFSGFTPCTDGNCVINKPEGMHTNGGCKCLLNLSRAQLGILTSRIQAIGTSKYHSDASLQRQVADAKRGVLDELNNEIIDETDEMAQDVVDAIRGYIKRIRDSITD